MAIRKQNNLRDQGLKSDLKLWHLDLTVQFNRPYIGCHKCQAKTHMSILVHFLDKMTDLYFLKLEALRNESVKHLF